MEEHTAYRAMSTVFAEQLKKLSCYQQAVTSGIRWEILIYIKHNLLNQKMNTSAMEQWLRNEY